MPTYSELITQSHVNVNALSEKLKGLDKLYQDIQILIEVTEELPKKFERQFIEISELSRDYTDNLGQATKKYLDGNNRLFTNNLGDFEGKIKTFNQEITRLKDTNLEQQFENLQQQFIKQTREDLAKELLKIDSCSRYLQTKINAFEKEINRLENIDLEKHFARHQKTLSEIFGAVNSINLTLTSITQAISNAAQSTREVKTLIEVSNAQNQSNHKQIQKLLEEKLSSISQQNALLKKQIVITQIVSSISLVFVIIILMVFIFK